MIIQLRNIASVKMRYNKKNLIERSLPLVNKQTSSVIYGSVTSLVNKQISSVIYGSVTSLVNKQTSSVIYGSVTSLVNKQTSSVIYGSVTSLSTHHKCVNWQKNHELFISNLIGSAIFVCLMVFNATFNNSSVISWRSILLMEEIGGPRENQRPVASHWQTL